MGRIPIPLLIVMWTVVMKSYAQYKDAAHDGPRLVWTELNDAERRARINSLPADPDTYISSNEITTRYYYQTIGSQFVGLTNDYTNGSTFWSASTNRSIFRGGLGKGASGEAIFTGTSQSVEGLAVDWLTQTLYWTDSSYDWIMASDYNATFYHILIDTGLEKPRGIATYPQRGYLFWTDWGEVKQIERATLGGLNRTTIVNSSLYFPNGIAVDYQTDRIYWTDAKTDGNRIESCDLDGNNRTVLITMEGKRAHFFDLEIYLNYIFVTDLTQQLRCVLKDTGKMSFSLNLGSRPFGVMTYGPGILEKGTSPCDSNPCQHLCTGGPDFTYQCLCSHGYKLTQNKSSCIKDENRITKPQLMFVNRNSINRYPSNFPDLTITSTYKHLTVVANRSHAVAIDMDSRGEMLFYSDYTKREIYSALLISGGGIKTIVGGIGSAEGLAVDWLNQNLYWTDAHRGHIAVARYDGSRRRYLFVDDVIRPRSLVIHAEMKYMFWTEFGPPGQVERGNLDGTGRLVIKTGISSPNGLAIDFKKNRLYYANRDNGVISTMDFNGNGETPIFERSGTRYFDIELFRDYLFFTSWANDNGLFAVNLNTKQVVQSMRVPKTAYGVRMFDDSRQPDGPSVCPDDTCDHLCLPNSQEGYICTCSLGFTLGADNVSCNVDILEDNFFLVTDTHIPGIFQVSMESPDRFTAIPLEGLVRPIAVTFDPVEWRVYWTDVRLGSFSRAFLNGSGEETLGRAGIDGPDGLTIDPISRLLYWTDVTRNTITVASLDGTQIKTLIDTDLDQPRAIVLDPVGGYMYFSDWGAVPKIEKAHMDGSNREVLVDSEIAWPNGLALDMEASKLYWCDARIDRIERINLDGTGRQLIVNLAPRGHPYGVAVVGPFIYWTDWRQYGLRRGQKTVGANDTGFGPQTFTRLSEIHAYNSSSALTGSNACTINNGGCSHLCIPTPVGRNCTCSDGIDLDPETRTTCLVSNTTCDSRVPHGHFLEDCSFAPGRRCTVECDIGYWSITKSYDILCLADGQWEEDMEDFCTVVECPEVNVTANASVVACADPPIQNSTCVHECNIGFQRISGKKRLVCRMDGTWSSSPLTCEAITCDPLQMPDNGLYSPQNCTTSGGLYDDTCVMFCRHGYRHQGILSRTCQLDGRWSDEGLESTCIDNFAPSFGHTCPQDMNITVDEGQTTVNLTWNPVAIDNSDGNITYIRSHPLYSQLEEGENFILIMAMDETNNSNSCNFTVNVIVRYCAYLSIPINGGFLGNCTYHYGSLCRFVCNDGYQLIGSDTRSCDMNSEGDLQWVGEKAICEAVRCPPPDADPKVYQSGCQAPYLAGVECSYMCAPGYYRFGGSTLTTCQGNGTWSGQRLQCHVRVCDPIPAFERGIITPQSCIDHGGAVGMNCTLSCEEGFNLEGMASHECLETGQWSNLDDLHFCEDATAPHFNNPCPEDFTVTAMQGETEANVTWEMPSAVDDHSGIWNITSSRQPGVRLPEGNHAIVVTATDSAGNPATCRFYVNVRVIRCPEQILPRNAYMTDECERIYGSKCTVGCSTGYNLSGASTRKCTWDGESSEGQWEWEGNEPVCQAVTCVPFQTTSEMLVFGCRLREGVNVPYGTTCNILCSRPSYFMFSSMVGRRRCQADGTWSGNEQLCQQPTCPGFTMPQHADLVRNADVCLSQRVDASTICAITCNPGYRLRGPSSYRCSPTGNWRPPLPRTEVCQDIQPPVFTEPCPRNVTVYTPPCSTAANVTFDLPQAMDNEESVLVTGPDHVFPLQLTRGTHRRVYSATDREGNTALCDVNIKVITPMCDISMGPGHVRVESMSCRNLYGSTVRYSCRPGMNLIGSQEQTCQMDGQWNGTYPTCEFVTCPSLELPSFAVATPSECESVQGVVGSTRCKITCEEGFALSKTSVISTTCTISGNWTTDISGIQCIDITPPVFSYCPSGVRVVLPTGESSTAVTWRIPVAYDNSGEVNMSHPNVSPPVVLAPGSEVFTYTATDAMGLSTRCSFEVVVVDQEPPSVMNCPSDTIVVQTASMPATIELPQLPEFDDNIGIEGVSHYGDLGSEVYEWGYSAVTYQAWDLNGNSASCVIQIETVESTVCPALETPPNSGSCGDSRTSCTYQCPPGYVFPTPGMSQYVYVCQASGLWNNSLPGTVNPYLPACTQETSGTPRRWEQSAEFTLRLPGDCDGMQQEIQQTMTQLFQTSSLFTSCQQDPANTCDISGINLSCGDSEVRETDRRKRSSDTESQDATTGVISVTMATQRSESSSIPSYVTDPTRSVSGLWSSDVTSITLSNMTAILDLNQSRMGDVVTVCGAGQVVTNYICVDCPVGAFYDALTVACVQCPKGQYQDEVGQSGCKLCGQGMSTRSLGAFSSDHCQVMCQPGTYSYLGLGESCLDCPVGSYQPDSGQRGCLPCANNLTTSGPGAVSSSACIDSAAVTIAPSTASNDITDTTTDYLTNGVTRTPPPSATVSITPPVVGSTSNPPISNAADKSSVTMATKTQTRARVTPGKKFGQKPQGSNIGMIVGVCLGLLVLVAVIIVIVVMWRRRTRRIPRTRLKSATSDGTPDNDSDDGADGRYHPLQELDNFDLEHIALEDELLQNKRSSFSNALYEHSIDEPQSLDQGDVLVLFTDSAESQT